MTSRLGEILCALLGVLFAAIAAPAQTGHSAGRAGTRSYPTVGTTTAATGGRACRTVRRHP